MRMPKLWELFTKLLSKLYYYMVTKLGLLIIKNLLKLQAFHNKCASQMCGNSIKLDPKTNEWFYPKTENVLKQCGLLPIEYYIQQRRNTLYSYIKIRLIYSKCIASSPLQSNANQLTWWKQKEWNLLYIENKIEIQCLVRVADIHSTHTHTNTQT